MANITCRSCGADLAATADNFQPDSRYKRSGGFRTTCRECAAGQRADRRSIGLADDSRRSRRKDRERSIEIAPRKSDLDDYFALFKTTQSTPDYLLISKSPGAYYNYNYGLYEEAIDKDPHLWALINNRKSAVMSLPREVMPADQSDEAAYAAEFIKRALREISRGDGDSGFDRDLSEMLDAIPYGFAVSELIWGEREFTVNPDGDDKSERVTGYIPTRIMSRHPRRFVFDPDGELMLRVMPRNTRNYALGEPADYLPPRKFLLFRPYTRFEDPFGLPVMRIIWWMTWVKLNSWKFWLYFTERFGSPTVAAETPRDLTDQERTDLLTAMNAIQQETGMVVPEGVKLMLLEAQRGSSVNTYQQIVDWADSQMSKAILGQTMTVDAPMKGSHSLGEVQADVAAAITTTDAHALEALVNGTLIPWIMDYNLPDYPMPELKFNTEVVMNMERYARVYEHLANFGWIPDEYEIKHRFNIKGELGPNPMNRQPQETAGPPVE